MEQYGVSMVVIWSQCGGREGCLTAGLYSRSNTNFFAAFSAFIIRMAHVARRYAWFT
jgi:hypothetical protein